MKGGGKPKQLNKSAKGFNNNFNKVNKGFTPKVKDKPKQVKEKV